MLSTVGWLNGLSATCVICMSVIFGILSFYHAKKAEAKLLAYAGILMVFTGLMYLGPFIDFLLILLTDKNINPPILLALLSYTWIGVALIPAMYIGGELMVPKKKWYIIGFYTILAVIFEIFLWVYTENSVLITLDNPGEELIDASYNRTSPAFFLVAFFLMSLLVFLGIGFAIKAKQATGELRKKFSLLSLAFVIFVISGVFEALTSPGIALVIVRLGMVTYAALMFIALKP